MSDANTVAKRVLLLAAQAAAVRIVCAGCGKEDCGSCPAGTGLTGSSVARGAYCFLGDAMARGLNLPVLSRAYLDEYAELQRLKAKLEENEIVMSANSDTIEAYAHDHVTLAREVNYLREANENNLAGWAHERSMLQQKIKGLMAELDSWTTGQKVLYKEC